MNQLRKINHMARGLSVLTLTAVLAALAAPAPADALAELIVASTADSGPGTLRQAIIQANSNPGPDTITFNLGGCALYCTISPVTALPPLSGGDTSIDGYTQPGAAPATDDEPGTIVVELDGSLSPAIYGLGMTSAGNTIQGLAITRFKGNGIAISGAAATGNVIAGNHIGVNPSADLSMGNLWDGVYIGEGATDNLVGGDTHAERNIIGGNGLDGVGIYGAGSDRNVVSGNFIGTNGVDPLGNNFSGVHIYGGAQDNWIGGNEAVERNLIAANGLHGVNIVGAGTDGNLVYGNEIGVALSNAAMGNESDGVHISTGAQSNLVGGINPSAAGNLISANLDNGVQITGTNTLSNTITNNIIGTFIASPPGLGNDNAGVLIAGGASGTLVGGDITDEGNQITGNDLGVAISGSDTTHNIVSGNRIGVDSDGTSSLGNNRGVYLLESTHHNRIGGANATPGGECSGECNLISGSITFGVGVQGEQTTENDISGNYIGTDVSGMLPLPNFNGIAIYNGASYNRVGGVAPAERNLISGNTYHGLAFDSPTTQFNVVTGNYIGTNSSGTAPVANGWDGIVIAYAKHNRVGGEAPGSGNLISGNGEYGISLFLTDSEGENNIVAGNIIGLDASGVFALGNGAAGIHIDDSDNNLIGGETSAGGNTISGNGAYGVRITNASLGNRLRYNRIGVSSSEMVSLGNASHGMLVDEGSQENIIGGADDTGGNLISGNLGDGLRIQDIDTTHNQVLGNLIGSQPHTFSDLGNAGSGVTIRAGASENTVAGHNSIVYNTYGVILDEDGTMQNTISANWIADSDFSGVYIGRGAKANTIGPENMIRSNHGDGVQIESADTYANVVTMNVVGENVEDGIDLVNGANHDIQPPVIDAVAGSTLSVQLSGSSCAGCIVEIFGNRYADGEGETYLDSEVAGIDGSWSLELERLFYPYLTATATGALDGTSEFSVGFANPYRYVFLPLVVQQP